MYIFEETQVKTRKKHNCALCGRVFPAGTIMYLNKYEDGDIGHFYECETCSRIIDEDPNICDGDGCYDDNSLSEYLDYIGFKGTPEEYLSQLIAAKTPCKTAR